MKQVISITAIQSLSALGSDIDAIWNNYLNDKHFISQKEFDQFTAYVAQISNDDFNKVSHLKSYPQYKNLDDSVLYAIYVAREAIKKSAWNSDDNFGVNFGSSRGATQLFEKYYKSFLEHGFAETLSSPSTTLGNISSWIAHDLQTKGPEISHSITCSTGLHSLLNGIAWLQSGMASKFLIGASEAALTDFTIAQMQALKVYAQINETTKYPCRALDLSKKRNTMILGEGASAICLEVGVQKKSLAIIEGVGYATEILKHSISISAEAECFQKSMKMALKNTSIDNVDAIVMHAPGTIKGDESEIKAIEKIFCNKKPFLTTNKWKLGHTFATSGLLSLELAVLMLQHQKVISVPFIPLQDKPKKIKKILVNAVGFGGNAVSVLLSKE